MKHIIGHYIGQQPNGHVYHLVCEAKALLAPPDLKFGQVVDLGPNPGQFCAVCQRLTAKPKGNVGGFNPHAVGLGSMDSEVLSTDTGVDEDGTVLGTEEDYGG